MAERSADWLRQADRDLESAVILLKNDYFEWSCFISQQAAEKAVKAILQKLGAEAWGHSISNLLQGVREKINLPSDLMSGAKQLDRYYIIGRYPNGWASGIPADYISKEDANDAIGYSRKIIRFCSDFLAE